MRGYGVPAGTTAAQRMPAVRDDDTPPLMNDATQGRPGDAGAHAPSPLRPRRGRTALGLHVGMLMGLLSVLPAASRAQQADIGLPPVELTSPQYLFETAERQKIRVVVVARGLARPFAVAVLPTGDALVSERSGRLRIVRNAAGGSEAPPLLEDQPIGGIPEVTPPFRNGGLHDVVLHPEFANNRLVYFTFNRGEDVAPDADPPARRRSAVTLWRGRFDGRALQDVEELLVGEWAGASGSRIAFGPDGMLYMTTGAPFGDGAQHLDNVYGKVLRLHDDGRIPADNPFVGRDDVRPEIFSFGHRDQLGLAVHAQTGAVLAVEHGPNGGDELNLILPGRNYGWPNTSFGRNYDGTPISATPVADGVEAPLVVWLPSIGPTGLAVYTADRFPAWRGNVFVGSARRGQIPGTGGLERVVLNENLEELRRETLLGSLHRRIRDVRQGPDGLLYVLTDDPDGALLRIEPAE
ncbi:MAG: hypothetical protein DIU71_01145 [Proteobacteria bacterium]|nr:MAG: hypothetical protein DIU71_01145 [Pseudomonadota bacterium]